MPEDDKDTGNKIGYWQWNTPLSSTSAPPLPFLHTRYQAQNCRRSRAPRTYSPKCTVPSNNVTHFTPFKWQLWYYQEQEPHHDLMTTEATTYTIATYTATRNNINAQKLNNIEKVQQYSTRVATMIDNR